MRRRPMSSKAARMKKTIKKLKFLDEMYNNILGSYMICLYILQSTAKPPKEIIKEYKRQKIRWLRDEVEESTWMEDVARALNAAIPYGKIALVNSKWNMLIAPYIDSTLYPIREDGFKGPTLLHGSIHPIQKEVKIEG